VVALLAVWMTTMKMAVSYRGMVVVFVFGSAMAAAQTFLSRLCEGERMQT